MTLNTTPKIRKPADPADYPVPERLNTLLVLLVMCCSIALLKLGSVFPQATVVIPVTVVFSYLMLTNYSLAHEAAHLKLTRNLHSNYLLGLIPATLFPMALSLLINAHETHHIQNRSPSEQFDLIIDGKNRRLKLMTWYAIMCGGFGLYPMLATVLLTFFPLKYLQFFFRNGVSNNAYMSRFTADDVRKIRREFIGIVVFHTGVILLFGINPVLWFVCYGAAWFNWSTRQFVEHAYTPLDAVEGCFNLSHNRFMSLLFLHREMDLSHHREPGISWYYLPNLEGAEDNRFSYLSQYFRMWKGPRYVWRSSGGELKHTFTKLQPQE